MNRENLKELKYSIEWVKEQIERYEEQRTIVLNITQNLDGMPKAKNKESYSIENLIDKYDELLQILAVEQEKINAVLIEINKLRPLNKAVITKRYIEGKTFETISSEIGYDYYNTCKIHGKALNEFDKLAKNCQDLPNNNVLL